ncbi:hypothetical protein [Streptomyces laurentii]|uniref:hypothetical protein n=1 Tax=Streptomyces laurentii TaxID=39478 RepID=UPI0036864C97
MDATPAPILDWGEPRHFDHRRDQPCCLCGRPTPMRSHDGEPVHKACAEQWNHTHPDTPRLYSPPDKTDPTRPQHDIGTRRFHNDGPCTPVLARPARTTPGRLHPNDGVGSGLFAA